MSNAAVDVRNVSMVFNQGSPGQVDALSDVDLVIEPGDLRGAIRQGQESNLVLLCVDASGSMGARRRMEEVKTAVLSLLTDAYERRDKVGLVTFRGNEAELSLTPTSSVEAAARCLAELPHGGRTPLAEGLTLAARVLGRERVRDPRRREVHEPLLRQKLSGGDDDRLHGGLSARLPGDFSWVYIHLCGAGHRSSECEYKI